MREAEETTTQNATTANNSDISQEIAKRSKHKNNATAAIKQGT